MAKEAHINQEQNTKDVLDRLKISISLDDYTDIFSDFDSRHFSQRTLSDDFLIEAKKASKEKIAGLELNFLIPKAVRKPNEESVIRKRLKDYFKKQHHLEKMKILNIRKFGARFSSIGIILMFLATFILFNFPEKSFLMSFLVVLLEPAGWFLLWEGMNQMIFEPKKLKEDMEFYRKMSSCEVNFFEY